MGDAASEARRCPSLQKVLANEASNEARGSSEDESPGQRVGFGTGRLTRWGFGTVGTVGLQKIHFLRILERGAFRRAVESRRMLFGPVAQVDRASAF